MVKTVNLNLKIHHTAQGDLHKTMLFPIKKLQPHRQFLALIQIILSCIYSSSFTPFRAIYLYKTVTTIKKKKNKSPTPFSTCLSDNP